MTHTPTDNKTTSYTKDLLILLSVPVFIIAVIVTFLYVPRLFANPTYDFIYCEGYSCENRFRVNSSGKLDDTSELDSYSPLNYRLFYYDLTRDATRPIQAADAGNLALDASSKSPDGYTLERGTNNGGFIFFGSNRDDWWLKKGLVTKPVSLRGYSITFIGWVIDNE